MDARVYEIDEAILPPPVRLLYRIDVIAFRPLRSFVFFTSITRSHDNCTTACLKVECGYNFFFFFKGRDE